MLMIERIVCVIKEYDYEIVNKIYIKTNNGKEHTISYSSDQFIGFEFTDVNIIFNKFNDFFEQLNIFTHDNYITNITNKQAFLVNKKINSLLSVYTADGKCTDFDISNMFDYFVSNTDLYIAANDMVLNILSSIREVLYGNKRKKS